MEGLEAQMDQIRSYLNKLTLKIMMKLVMK